jgi:hypothetical protein
MTQNVDRTEDHQFRNTGTLMRDGFMIAQFEDDAKSYPKQVGKLYIDGNWHTVEQARELRDFLNQVLPEEVCETCSGRKFRTVHLLDGSDADDQPCPDCNPNGDSRDAP